MKRTTVQMITLLAIMTLLLAAVPSAFAAERTATVNNPNPMDRLNLRKEARTDAISFGKYYNGVTVEQLSDEKDGWMKVRIGNLTGYMETAYLTYGYDEKQVDAAMPTVTIRNSGGTGLHLRASQSTNAKSLGLYKNGTSVRVLGISETWAHVDTNDGKVGFMLLEHLSPELAWQYGTSGATGGGTGSSSSGGTSGGGSWDGPTGKYKVGQWTPVIIEYLAAVNNPNSGDRLHLRTSASDHAASLGKYYNGVQVIIIGIPQGDWLPVQIGNLEGYMNTNFLIISGEGIPYPASAMPVMVVNNPNAAKNLNLRERQSTSSKSLGIFANGTEVTMMGFTSEWAHVIVGGQMGFMQTKYLSVGK